MGNDTRPAGQTAVCPTVAVVDAEARAWESAADSVGFTAMTSMGVALELINAARYARDYPGEDSQKRLTDAIRRAERVRAHRRGALEAEMAAWETLAVAATGLVTGPGCPTCHAPAALCADVHEDDEVRDGEDCTCGLPHLGDTGKCRDCLYDAADRVLGTA